MHYTLDIQILRARQRGAAVFVVLLVITLLTTLGVFAVRSSSMSTAASGFDRQMTQTHYISEYGMVGAAAYLDSRGQVLSDKMMDANLMDTTCMGVCRPTPPTVDLPKCAKLGYADMNGLVSAATNNQEELIEPVSGPVYAPTAVGSLGPSPLEADYDIEVTDWYEAWPPLAGFDATDGKLTHAMVTVTVTGMVRPPQQTAGQFDTASATAAGVEATRGHIILGPVVKRMAPLQKPAGCP
jgi:hypothetical protein